MKNNAVSVSKIAIGFLTVIAAVSIALPASADTTTAGYYDQFGNFHVYQVYTPPANYYGGGNVYYGGTPYIPYSTGYNTYTRTTALGGQVTCTTGEYYDTFNNICVPANRRGTTTVATNGIDYTGSKTTTTKPAVSNDNFQSSAISTILGGKKAAGKLEITNILVTSGPLNIYNDKTDVNCDVSVSWNTGVATAGQVVYGTISQPNIDSFSYPLTAPESNSLTTAHSVKLGCLDNTTYYFRIIAFTANDRVVSSEQIVFPIKIRTQIPVVGSSSNTDSGASIMSTLGKIIVSPITLLIALGVIAYLVVARMLRGSKAGAHAAPAHAEPELLIPHH